MYTKILKVIFYREKNMPSSKETLKVGLAQISPIWLNREKTLEKVISYT